MTSIRRKRKCLTIGTQETRLLVWTAPESGTKKPPKAAVAADTPLMTGIGGRRRGGGRLDGRRIPSNWPAQSLGAVGEITMGGSDPTSHAKMANLSPAHWDSATGISCRPSVINKTNVPSWRDVMGTLLVSPFAV